MKQLILISAGLILLIAAAFEPVRHNDFVQYDDDPYITQNAPVLQGLTLDGIKWAFTAHNLTANWHPLTWLSHMADIELFGLNPLGHHLHNLALHTASTVLLFWLLYRMTGSVGCSAFAAMVFGIHPLRVESVAWAAERKDVLSVLFFMLTIAAYLYYANKGGIFRYLLVVLCFALGLMAKPILVTLPFILLILDFWPLKNKRGLTCARLIAEKIPLIILAAVSCWITYQVQQQGGGKMYDVPLLVRLLNIPTACVGYIGKLFWPANLAVLYPYSLDRPWWQGITALGVLLSVTGFVIYRALRYPWLAAGWLWYIVMLIPVIGLIQVGVQAMADRYTYLPSIGLAIIVSWTMAQLSEKWPYRKMITAILAGLIVTAMVTTTRKQLTYWTDAQTLFEHTLSVTGGNFIMHYNLGLVLLKQNQLQQAAEQFEKTLQIMPQFPDAGIHLADILSSQNRFDLAAEQLAGVLEYQPDNVDARYKMGQTFETAGKLDEAIAAYRQTVCLDPNHADAFNNLGVLYGKKGFLDQAVECFGQSLRINPDSAGTCNNMAFALKIQGRNDPAILYYQKALAIEPNNYKRYCDLASCLYKSGKTQEAIEILQKAVEMAAVNGRTEIIEVLQEHLRLYRTGQTPGP